MLCCVVLCCVVVLVLVAGFAGAEGFISENRDHQTLLNAELKFSLAVEKDLCMAKPRNNV